MTFIPDLFNIVFSNPILSNDDRMRRHSMKSNFGAKCLFLGKTVHWRRYVRSKWPVDAFWRQQINSGPDGKKVSRLPPLLLKPLTPGTMNLYWVSFSKNMLGRQIDEDLKFRLYHHSESDRIQLMERLQGPFGHLHPNWTESAHSRDISVNINFPKKDLVSWAAISHSRERYEYLISSFCKDNSFHSSLLLK